MVFAQAAALIQPNPGTLYHPTPGKKLKSSRWGRELSEWDTINEPNPSPSGADPAAIYRIRWIDYSLQEHSLCIHQNMALAPFDLLGTVLALHPSDPGRFDALGIDQTGMGLSIPALLSSLSLTSLGIDIVLKPVPAPSPLIMTVPVEPLLIFWYSTAPAMPSACATPDQ